MNLKSSLIFTLFTLVISCKDYQQTKTADSTTPLLGNYSSTAHLIEAEDLLTKTDRRYQKIIDFRKKEDYQKGHIPGALQMHRPDIEDNSYPYKGMMASKKAIEVLFSKLGISTIDTLVVYDDKGGSDAARLWWLLQNYDYNKVKLLNGGFRAWKALNGAQESKQVSLEPTNFMLPNEGSMSYLVHREELQNLLSTDNKLLILDVRSEDEHSGKRQKSGALRAGRIPKSELIDWSRAIDYHGTHKFLPYDELEVIYGNLGAEKEDTIITYCHTGVRSAHTTFVLSELLGYSNVKNYDGSWSEWSYYKDLPSEKDSTTIILQ